MAVNAGSTHTTWRRLMFMRGTGWVSSEVVLLLFSDPIIQAYSIGILPFDICRSLTPNRLLPWLHFTMQDALVDLHGKADACWRRAVWSETMVGETGSLRGLPERAYYTPASSTCSIT